MTRILNTLLLLIAVLGAFCAWRARAEFEATRREHSRLTVKVGRMPIEDEAKAHLLAIETQDPLDFKWQVYVPANFSGKWECVQLRGGSSAHSGSNPESQTALVRVRFRKIDGQWHVWRKFTKGSGASALQHDLFDAPESLTIEQLGTGSVKVLEADEIVTLLKITPDAPLRPSDRGKPLMTIKFGSGDAWKKQTRNN